MEELAAFAGIWVTVWLAFAVFLLQEPAFDFRVAVFYSALTVVPLIGLGFLIWGHEHMDTTQKQIHRFSAQTVHCAGALFCFVVVATIVSLYSYANGQFPTQPKPRLLESLDAKPGHFDATFNEFGVKEGQGKLTKMYVVESEHPPDPVVVEIGDFQGIPEGWRIVNVVGYDLSEHQQTQVKRGPVPEISSNEKRATVLWSGLKGKRRYGLEVVLHQGTSNVPPEEFARSIDGVKILTAKAYVRD